MLDLELELLGSIVRRIYKAEMGSEVGMVIFRLWGFSYLFLSLI